MEEQAKTREPRRQRDRHSAEQRVQAVLSVWTERRKPLEICRELGIAWTILDQWQKRAMTAMLQALEPKATVEKGQALNPKLVALLRHRRSEAEAKISRRLARAEKKPETKE